MASDKDNRILELDEVFIVNDGDMIPIVVDGVTSRINAILFGSGLFIPYTGATSNVNLNSKQLNNAISLTYTGATESYSINKDRILLTKTGQDFSAQTYVGLEITDTTNNNTTAYRRDGVVVVDGATPANNAVFGLPIGTKTGTQWFAMLSDLQNSAIETITAGENLVAGDLVYLKTDGKYWKADYLDETKVSTELRYVLGTITANATGSAQITGNVTSSGLTTGERYCVGVNGAIVLESAIPDTEGIFIRYIGTAESATDLFFNPESTYIEVTLTPPTGTAGINRLIENRAGVTVTLGNAVLTDYVQNCTGTNTLTLPTAIGNNNKYTVTLISGTTTINTTGGQTINGSSSITMVLAYLSYDFISDGSNWLIR